MLRVVIPGDITTAQKIATLAEIVRSSLKSDVVAVIAWRTTDEEAGNRSPYTVGIAEMSTDGRGWSGGDGARTIDLFNDGDFGPDNGEVQGKVVTTVVSVAPFLNPRSNITELFTAPR